MTARSLPKITAFTFAELLTILALLAVLAGLVLPAIARSQTQTSVTQCAANLEQVLLATQMYATDNNNKLPQITSGNWPWDLPGRTEYSFEQYGARRPQFYDPGFPQQNIDQLWNYSVVYSSTGVPINGYRTTGYAFAFNNSPRVPSDDMNSSFSAQVFHLANPPNDPSLIATIPALPGRLLKIQPSRRVLISDALTTYGSQTDPAQYASYTWNLHTDSGNPALWTNTP